MKDFTNARRYIVLGLIPVFGLLHACTPPTDEQNRTPDPPQSPAMSEGGSTPKGGIEVPASVRDNLGITFATVEKRAVAETRRVPGQFELIPTARQEVRVPLAGRIDLHVEQFQEVSAGETLLTIDSPDWRRIQHEAVEAEGDIVLAEANLAVARAQRDEARAALGNRRERLANLAEVEVRNADLETEVSNLRNSLPRLDAEVEAHEALLREAHEHYDSRLNALSSITGDSVEDLREETGQGAVWRTITSLPLKAERDGVVESLAVSDGGWLESDALALSVVDPTRIRFHADAPQSDIAIFRDGQSARIVPPQGGSIDLQSSLSGTLKLALTAHERDRTISLYVTPDEPAPWAKAGIGGYLEVSLADDVREELAIPEASIIQDGLEHVFYRRDPKDPDRVRRVVADLGPSDGRWTVLRSGVMAGDEVVLGGVYALKLSSAEQQAPDGYHYHADGSLHKDH